MSLEAFVEPLLVLFPVWLLSVLFLFLFLFLFLVPVAVSCSVPFLFSLVVSDRAKFETFLSSETMITTKIQEQQKEGREGKKKEREGQHMIPR